MKKVIILSICLLPFRLIGQSKQDLTQINSHVLNTPENIEKDIKALSQYLIAPAESDLDKVSNLYQWLIYNLEYDQKAFKKGNKRVNRSNADILNRGEAICWGYATLFKAMCNAANIPCEVISGYSKTPFTAKADLEKPNHAWNSVKIDSVWYLVDATWDSGLLGKKGDFEKQFGYTYFLTPPKYFIINHLPAVPNWQLLECPIAPEDYQLSPSEIIKLVEKTDCNEENDLSTIEKLSIPDKRLLTAFEAYKYNPTETNRRELAHAQIDYEEHLTVLAERLQGEKKIDSLLLLQADMIQLCETASQLTDLFDTQKENCAYNYFNYAVTLTQVTANGDTQSLQKWQAVLNNLEKAQEQLTALPQNIFTQNALSHCTDYIDYAKKNMEALK